MDNLQDILILGGMTSVALLWAFSIAGALQTLWDTFGDHASSLVDRIRK